MRDGQPDFQAAWGAPASLLTIAAEWLVGRSIDLRLRRARHLVAVGRTDAAQRLYGAITDDVEASRALVRWWGGDAP